MNPFAWAVAASGRVTVNCSTGDACPGASPVRWNVCGNGYSGTGGSKVVLPDSTSCTSNGPAGAPPRFSTTNGPASGRRAAEAGGQPLALGRGPLVNVGMGGRCREATRLGHLGHLGRRSTDGERRQRRREQRVPGGEQGPRLQPLHTQERGPLPAR